MSMQTIVTEEARSAEAAPIQISIVSDFICPWCLIGHQRLKSALAELDMQADVEITWLPFELNPEMPTEGRDRQEYRTAKFGSWAYSKRLDGNTVEAGAPDGVTFNYDLIERTPNTFNAHRLSWFTARIGRQTEMVVALLEAYFQKGRDIGDVGALADVAGEIGFNRAETLRFLESEEGVEKIRYLAAQIRSAVQGVPHVEIGDAVIQGAQPIAIFRAAIDSATKAAAGRQ